MTYVVHKSMKHASSAGLGAAAPTSATAQFFNIEEVVGDIVEGVAGQVMQGVTSSIDRNMDRVTTVVSDGLDRFVSSPKGAALFQKISEKAESAVLQVVSNQKTNLALLGVAGVAFMMGSVAVGSKMSPMRTKIAFGIGAAALAAVAFGVGSPPALTPVKPPFDLSKLPKRIS